MRCLPLDRHFLVGLLAVLAAVVGAPLIGGGAASDDAVAASAVARAAQSDAPSGRPADARFPLDGPAISEARRIAERHWGASACGGRVELAWGVLAEGTNATASWKNPTDAWNNAGENFDCRIELNARARYDWAKLCTVMAHEVGHLLGRPHAQDPSDLMAPEYRRPLDVCAQTPEPGTPAPAPPATPSQAPRTFAATSAPIKRAVSTRRTRAKVAGRTSYGAKRSRRTKRLRIGKRCSKRGPILFSSAPRARRATVRTASCKRAVVTLRKAR